MMPTPTSFEPRYGTAVIVNDAPLVRRLTANNPTQMTFMGTNSYLIGDEAVAILDPGPWDSAHQDALVEAAEAQGYASHIILTHHHPDHTDGVLALKQRLGVPVFGTADCVARGIPVDVIVNDGDELTGYGWTMNAMATPGHTADHLCYTLAGTNVLFSGDHVMGWSTSVIIPPDGDLSAYLSSLDAVARNQTSTRYLPGHGDEIPDGPALARAMRKHRLSRSTQILTALQGQSMTHDRLLDVIYPTLDPGLRGAAALSLEAHVIQLIAGNQLENKDGLLTLTGG